MTVHRETAPTGDYEWRNVTLGAAFAPRDGAGALVYGGRMWLIGGWSRRDTARFPRICSNDVWSSTDGLTWIQEKPNTFVDQSFDPALDWEGRHTAGYAVHQGKMWIVGGDVNQKHYQNDVWNSTDGRRWTYVNKGKPVPWGPRALHYTVAFKDRLWVMGGQTLPGFAEGDEVFYDDIWSSTDGVNWERVNPQGPRWPQRGMIGGAAVFKDRIWLLGGGTYDTPQHPIRKYYNDVWSSPDGVHWTCHTASAPWYPRQYHEVAVFDGRLWVMEGFDGGDGTRLVEGFNGGTGGDDGRLVGNRKDVWCSADGVHWQEVPRTPWNRRHAASVFVYDNALWMVAGNNMESDVWKLVKRDNIGVR